MVLMSGLMVVISGIFYLAGHHDMYALRSVCSYTDQIFCHNPQWFLYAAGPFALGALLSKLGG